MYRHYDVVSGKHGTAQEEDNHRRSQVSTQARSQRVPEGHHGLRGAAARVHRLQG